MIQNEGVAFLLICISQVICEEIQMWIMSCTWTDLSFPIKLTLVLCLPSSCRLTLTSIPKTTSLRIYLSPPSAALMMLRDWSIASWQRTLFPGFWGQKHTKTLYRSKRTEIRRDGSHFRKETSESCLPLRKYCLYWVAKWLYNSDLRIAFATFFLSPAQTLYFLITTEKYPTNRLEYDRAFELPF